VLAVISEGEPQRNREEAASARLTSVWLQRERDVATAYRAYGTPSAALIDEAGRIAAPLAIGADAIRALLQAAARPRPQVAAPLMPSPPPRALAIGDPSPALALETLDGRRLSLGAPGPIASLLLFWNPSCGFCQQMVGDLLRLDAALAERAVRLVLVSAGDGRAERALSLSSALVLDRGDVAAAFGANGTPMAIRIDPQGRVASKLAVGRAEILALAQDAGAAESPARASSLTVRTMGVGS
jgi:hypothetical protein